MNTPLKKGRIVMISRQPQTRGMGCVCTGPAYGTPFCECELAYMQSQPVDDDEDYDEFEDRKK